MLNIFKTKSSNYYPRRLDIRNYDFKLVSLLLILSLIGIAVINSAADGYASRQTLGLVVGTVAMIIVSLIDYKYIAKFQWILYAISIALLVFVLLFGITINNARRWFSLGSFGTLQPSEFSKIIMIIVFAKFISDHRDRINKFSFIALSGIMFVIPMFLIYIEPNLSTTLVFVFLYCIMLFAGGLSYKIIAGVFATIIPLAALFIWYVQQPFQSLLYDHQVLRIKAMLNPSEYLLTEYYQQYNSTMAIGSGMLFGKGLNNNTITSVKGADFISEPQTDFIFSIVGEELGFIGSCIVIILLFLMVFECLKIAKDTNDLLGRLIVTGVAAVIAFQTFVNIGVATGMLPNTGLPLPFISYGLSSLLSNFIGIGLVLNVGLHRNRR